MSDFLFEREIRIFGIKRSGNHAVLSFLWDHFPMKKKEIVHLGNTNLSLFPMHPKEAMEFGSFARELRRTWDVDRTFINGIEHLPTDHIAVLLQPFYLYNRQRREWAFKYEKKYFARKVYNIIILRSFHNNLASLVKLGEIRDTHEEEVRSLFYGSCVYKEFTELWVQYAKEIAGITNYIPNKIVIIYDEFVSSEDYRREISHRLGLEHVDSGINFVARAKSSFDYHKYRGEALKMKVLDRWKYFYEADYPNVWWSLDECRNMILNQEVVKYNKDIFGIDLRELF